MSRRSSTGLVPNMLLRVFKSFSGAGIVREITGEKRNRLCAYGELLDIMDEGTRPL